MTFHKFNYLNTCGALLIELRYRKRNYTVSEAATQLQCFKQIGSDQSYRLTIWGRMVVFQTRAICGTRTEEKLIILQCVDKVCNWVSVFVCVLSTFKTLLSTPFSAYCLLSDCTSNAS